ncbi:hypothetical protein [Petrachloros mirabilis]
MSDTNVDGMVNHGMPIAQCIDWLVDRARRHSQEFQSPESWSERSRYLAQHPTAVAAFKYEDGHINIPAATNAPHGIILAFRNLGGRFDLGGPHLGEVLAEHVQSLVRQRRGALALLPYHFMSEFADDVICAEFPRLAEKMPVRTAVFAWENRAMEMIEIVQPTRQVNTSKS